MNKAANSYWIDTRLAAQRPATRALTLAPSPAEAITDVIRPRVAARSARFAIPSWVVFCMIMLATFALCATVTMRTHAEMRVAEEKYNNVNTDVEQLRTTNESLRREVERLRTDPRAIEAAARTRLNMVRANEIVVPLK